MTCNVHLIITWHLKHHYLVHKSFQLYIKKLKNKKQQLPFFLFTTLNNCTAWSIHNTTYFNLRMQHIYLLHQQFVKWWSKNLIKKNRCIYIRCTLLCKCYLLILHLFLFKTTNTHLWPITISNLSNIKPNKYSYHSPFL